MNQNTYFYIFIVLVILVIIKYISPDPDSVLFVLKKYLNFIIFKINSFIKSITGCNEKFSEVVLNSNQEYDFNGKTFQGIKNYQDKAPTFITYYENYFIERMLLRNPNFDINMLKRLYMFIDRLVTLDVDDYFMTVNNSEEKTFTPNEISIINKILSDRLNIGEFKFTNIKINEPITYYNNVSGKQINPFGLIVDCNKDIGKLKLLIESDIRHDVIKNSAYFVIKKVKIIIDEVNNTKYIPVDSIYLDMNATNYFDINEIKPIVNSIKPPINSEKAYNVEFNDIEIPNYEDLINDTSSKNKLYDDQILNVSNPFIDFSKDFNPNKKTNSSNMIEPSNNNDTFINMLDNINSFEIPHENKVKSSVTV